MRLFSCPWSRAKGLAWVTGKVWGALGFGLSAMGALQVQQQSREWEGLFRQLPGQQPTAEASRGAEAQVFCALSGTVPEVNTCICDTSN